MDLNLANLGDLGLSEAQIDEMFKARGIALNKTELRSSKSFKNLKEEAQKENMDLSYADHSKKENEKLYNELEKA